MTFNLMLSILIALFLKGHKHFPTYSWWYLFPHVLNYKPLKFLLPPQNHGGDRYLFVVLKAVTQIIISQEHVVPETKSWLRVEQS